MNDHDESFMMGKKSYPIHQAPECFTTRDALQPLPEPIMSVTTLIVPFLDASSIKNSRVDNQCLFEVVDYCQKITPRCIDSINTKKPSFPLAIIRPHTHAMKIWLSHRYCDTYMISKKQRLSLAAMVGFARLYMLFVDQFFEKYTATLPPSPQISMGQIDVYDLVFTPEMFDRTTRFADDMYNPVRAERARQETIHWPKIVKRTLLDEALTNEERRRKEQIRLEQIRQQEQFYRDLQARQQNHRADGDESTSAMPPASSATTNTYTGDQPPAAATTASGFTTRILSSDKASASASSTSSAGTTTGMPHSIYDVTKDSDDTRDWRAYVDTYVVPREQMQWKNHMRKQVDDETVIRLCFIMDMMIRKMNLACVFKVNDLSTPKQWNYYMQVFDMIAMLFFCQMHHRDYVRIEMYVRYVTWIEVQLDLLRMFRLEKIVFKNESLKALKDELDYNISRPPDASLSQSFTTISELHYMTGAVSISLFQSNPFINTKVNHKFVLMDKFHDDEQVYLGQRIVTDRSQDVYANEKHPFYHLFVLNLFGCHLSWEFKKLQWNRQFSIYNYELVFKLKDLRAPYDSMGRKKRPYTVCIFGVWYELSFWRSDDEDRVHPMRYEAVDPFQHILTKQWLLLKDYNGCTEDGLPVAERARRYFIFEPNEGMLCPPKR